MASLEDLLANSSFTTAVKGKVTFLPEPERATRRVHDHLRRRPHRRAAARLRGAVAGQVRRTGAPGRRRRTAPTSGSTTARSSRTSGSTPSSAARSTSGASSRTRFDDMRRGAWDIHDRIKDMDLYGVYASLCFPSFLPGFGGQRLQLTTKDPELALAAVRAWNDWHIEEWSGRLPGPDHPVPDPVLARPRDRRAGDLPQRRAGLQGGHVLRGARTCWACRRCTPAHWDPIMRACAETGTVVNLHIGSSGYLAEHVRRRAARRRRRAVLRLRDVRRPSTGSTPGSRCASPTSRSACREGGIGWVPALLDRLDHMRDLPRRCTAPGTASTITPAEVLQRNFYFCAVEDPTAFALRERIGVDHILLEEDYPHSDSLWPRTQAVIDHVDRPPAGGRHPQVHLGERLQALPPPGAAERHRRSRTF